MAPLQRYANHDATDAFAALHGAAAYAKLAQLPTAAAPSEAAQEASKLEMNFRAFRGQLERDGWFTRNLWLDLAVVLHVPALAALGSWLAWQQYTLLATLAIGLAMEQAGWAAHDYAHARNGIMTLPLAQTLGGVINGFSATWWNRKVATETAELRMAALLLQHHHLRILSSGSQIIFVLRFLFRARARARYASAQ